MMSQKIAKYRTTKPSSLYNLLSLLNLLQYFTWTKSGFAMLFNPCNVHCTTPLPCLYTVNILIKLGHLVLFRALGPNWQKSDMFTKKNWSVPCTDFFLSSRIAVRNFREFSANCFLELLLILWFPRYFRGLHISLNLEQKQDYCARIRPQWKVLFSLAVG